MKLTNNYITIALIVSIGIAIGIPRTTVASCGESECTAAAGTPWVGKCCADGLPCRKYKYRWCTKPGGGAGKEYSYDQSYNGQCDSQGKKCVDANGTPTEPPEGEGE